MAGSPYDGDEPEQRDGEREMIAGDSRERDHGHAAAGEKTMTGKLVQFPPAFPSHSFNGRSLRCC